MELRRGKEEMAQAIKMHLETKGIPAGKYDVTFEAIRKRQGEDEFYAVITEKETPADT